MQADDVEFIKQRLKNTPADQFAAVIAEIQQQFPEVESELMQILQDVMSAER